MADTVVLEVPISQKTYEDLSEIASGGSRSPEEVARDLIETELSRQARIAERFDRLSDSYRARLAREGKLNRTPEEVLEELRQIREQVANEKYPG